MLCVKSYLLSLSVFQHCTLLHLRMVQQHRDQRVASPAARAGDQHQLQCDGAGGAPRLAGQNRPQCLLWAGCGHRRVLAGLPWQLGWVHNNGRANECSIPCSLRHGVRRLIQTHEKISLKLMGAVLFTSTGWQHGSSKSKLSLLALIFFFPLLLAANLPAAWTDITGQLQSYPDSTHSNNSCKTQ